MPFDRLQCNMVQSRHAYDAGSVRIGESRFKIATSSLARARGPAITPVLIVHSTIRLRAAGI
jgi:hypothetical protein